MNVNGMISDNETKIMDTNSARTTSRTNSVNNSARSVSVSYDGFDQKSTSVLTVLSWASSMIIIEYFFNLGSKIASLNNIPSVKNFIFVFFDSFSSNLTEYPTISPIYD